MLSRALSLLSTVIVTSFKRLMNVRLSLTLLSHLPDVQEDLPGVDGTLRGERGISRCSVCPSLTNKSLPPLGTLSLQPLVFLNTRKARHK